MLKACGVRGKEAVEELGLTISLAYISKLTKELEGLGLIEKVRAGKHYRVEPGPRHEEYFEWLDDGAPEDWGESAIREDEFQDRLKAMKLIEAGGVDISKGGLAPRAAWGYLMGLFNRGETRIVMVPIDAEVRVIERDENGKAKARKVKTWS